MRRGRGRPGRLIADAESHGTLIHPAAPVTDEPNPLRSPGLRK
jgi:hypothetical protein